MTQEEIKTILDKKLPIGESATLILASHLRGQIDLLKEMIARMGDKDDKYQLRSKVLRLHSELTKLNQ